jgi:hypothetical protein
VYGKVPPVTDVIEADPLLAPAHVTFVPVIVDVIAVGLVKVSDRLVLHPFPSVTVTV